MAHSHPALHGALLWVEWTAAARHADQGRARSGDAEVWCCAETQCQGWEWRAWSEMLSSSPFWNSETRLAIFQ